MKLVVPQSQPQQSIDQPAHQSQRLNPQPSPNPSEDWFRASEAAGDFMGIRYGKISIKTGEIQWFHVSHCDNDGIGGFARLLREQGAQIPELPKTKHPCRRILRPLWLLWHNREKPGTCAVRNDWLPPTRSEDIAWHLFTKDETLEIVRNCRALQITVNSCLLQCLDQTVREEIGGTRKKLPWIVPVNLRGDVQYADDTQNHVSCVEVHIATDDLAEAIHRQIMQRLERGEHRANHLLLTLGGILSHQAKVKFLAKDRAKPNGNIGSFSNLGVWDPSPQDPDENAWTFCPPVVAGQRLGAGCVTFQGRLALATQGGSASPRMAGWVNLIRTGYQ